MAKVTHEEWETSDEKARMFHVVWDHGGSSSYLSVTLLEAVRCAIDDRPKGVLLSVTAGCYVQNAVRIVKKKPKTAKQ